MPKGSNISCQSLVQPEIGISRSHVTYFLVDLKIWGPKTWLELIHLRARSWGTVWLQCSRSKVISVVYSPTSWSCLISELHFPVFGSDSVSSQIPPKDSSTLIRINFCYLPWKKKKISDGGSFPNPADRCFPFLPLSCTDLINMRKGIFRSAQWTSFN